MNAAIAGYFTALSLIVAIGAQNAFVLRQGLKRAHVFLVVMICALSDAILITVGVFASAKVEAAFPAFLPVMLWGGAAFLILYGLRSARSAIRGGGHLTASDDVSDTALRVGLTCLALTWLNPHVYLDTVVLMGAISTNFDPHRAAYTFGAILGSFSFFFALGYGARLLAPIFAREAAWRVLDGLIACVMWLIAAKLIHGALS